MVYSLKKARNKIAFAFRFCFIHFIPRQPETKVRIDSYPVINNQNESSILSLRFVQENPPGLRQQLEQFN